MKKDGETVAGMGEGILLMGSQSMQKRGKIDVTCCWEGERNGDSEFHSWTGCPRKRLGNDAGSQRKWEKGTRKAGETKKEE